MISPTTNNPPGGESPRPFCVGTQIRVTDTALPVYGKRGHIVALPTGGRSTFRVRLRNVDPREVGGIYFNLCADQFERAEIEVIPVPVPVPDSVNQDQSGLTILRSEIESLRREFAALRDEVAELRAARRRDAQILLEACARGQEAILRAYRELRAQNPGQALAELGQYISEFVDLDYEEI